ncbi:hypothetical protein PR202_gb02633 [Eleusine coracana subsp. coracana]|uniref:Thaumatin-like protein n=1 Tax=Eleusine coracana subsp. coracana TaxID=191504 RepID=A0AAV5DZ04_ELECO|nr:hypothetical protein PR202_gb02633 [Eleusine coracana subsp. coracana]
MEALRTFSCSPRLWIFVLALTHWCSVNASAASSTFTISNYCPHPIWPGTLAGAGTPQLSTTGFRLDPGQSAQVAAPAGWSGRVWARTGCAFDDAGAGSGRCETGDCGGGRLQCAGAGAAPPATLFEITLAKGGGGDKDYYDVSLVDGYNLPVVAVPRARQGGGCNATGCAADLNRCCIRLMLNRAARLRTLLPTMAPEATASRLRLPIAAALLMAHLLFLLLTTTALEASASRLPRLHLVALEASVSRLRRLPPVVLEVSTGSHGWCLRQRARDAVIYGFC